MRARYSISASSSSAAGNIPAAREAALRAKETYARLNSVYLVLVLSNLAAYAIAAGEIDDARGICARRSTLQRFRLRLARRGPRAPRAALPHFSRTMRVPCPGGFTDANTFRAAKCGRRRSVAVTNA